ncbi:MAG: phospholipase [Bacteroidia bacterium]|nr:MAG: phospholipase [Bacteroidia bacterium]
MKQKVALVLSGGGARGIAHIGVIEELERLGYEITSIAGTSMGSMVGGVYALGKMEEFRDWICTLDKRKVFSLLDFTLSKQGLIKGDKVLNKIRDFIPDTRIEELPIPYAAVAVDLINKKEVVFREGSLYHAVRASIAIPSVLTPVKGEHSLLVDGGVMNNLPMNHVHRTEGDLLVAVNVNADVPPYKPATVDKEASKKHSLYQEKIKDFYNQLLKRHPQEHEDDNLGYFSLLSRTIDLLTMQMANLALQNYHPDILVEVSHESCSIFDFYKAEEMLETGRQMARATLDSYRTKLSN